MKGTILELHKDRENWKVEIIVNQRKRKSCDSDGKICPNSKRKGVPPKFAVFSHKVVETNFDEVVLNKENFHCEDCADDILRGLETSRSGVIVKNPEVLAILRQELIRNKQF